MLIGLAHRVFELDAGVSVLVVLVVVLVLLRRDKKKRADSPNGSVLVLNDHKAPDTELLPAVGALPVPQHDARASTELAVVPKVKRKGPGTLGDEVAEVVVPAPWMPSWLPGGGAAAPVDPVSEEGARARSEEVAEDDVAAELGDESSPPAPTADVGPAWLPDPSGDPDKLRFWNGETWTTKVARRAG